MCEDATKNARKAQGPEREAQKEIAAAFESINAGIESTGELIRDLFGDGQMTSVQRKKDEK